MFYSLIPDLPSSPELPPAHPDPLSSPKLPPAHLELISISSTPEKGSQLWLAKLNLYQRDKEILCSIAWLNDSITFAAQTLLATQTKGKVCGFQSTQLSKTENMFKPLPPGPFIQILHVGGCHWAVASNIDVQSFGASHSDAVGIYDSARPSYITLQMKKVICSFLSVCPMLFTLTL